MLWSTKLQSTTLKIEDFGETFRENVKKYNTQSEALIELKKALKKAPENEVAQVESDIAALKTSLDKLNGKLFKTISRYEKNPEAVAVSKERMIQYHKNRKAGGTVPTTATVTPPPPPVKEEKEVVVEEVKPTVTVSEPPPSQNGHEKPKAAAATPQPTKQPPPPPKPAAVTKKKSAFGVIGAVFLAFLFGVGAGVAVGKISK